ncbi:MAG: hypothetical protein CM1200mP41_16230 [Gammaproteobacteria bacterium]|nr:MAG: hypothetical protein CM1200mP41_16230 [Gammaproteobacteria bacterium]
MKNVVGDGQKGVAEDNEREEMIFGTEPGETTD